MSDRTEEIRAPGQPVDKCPRCGQQSSPGCPFCEMVATFARVLQREAAARVSGSSAGGEQ